MPRLEMVKVPLEYSSGESFFSNERFTRSCHRQGSHEAQGW